MKLCAHFKKGQCPRGDACNFAHGMDQLHPSSPELAGMPMTPVGFAAPVAKRPRVGAVMAPMAPPGLAEVSMHPQVHSESFRPKRLCNHFSMHGVCKMGSACGFAHGVEELHPDSAAPVQAFPVPSRPQQLRVAPQIAPYAPVAAAPRDFRPMKLCRHFALNQCRAGGNCGFAHGPEELHPDSLDLPHNMQKQRAPGYMPMRLCNHFLTTGTCAMGDRCGFAHGLEQLHPESPELARLGLAPEEAAFTEAVAPPLVSMPPVTQVEVPQQQRAGFRPMRLCMHAANGGTCFMGDRCGFAHSAEQLHPESPDLLGLPVDQAQFPPQGDYVPV